MKKIKSLKRTAIIAVACTIYLIVTSFYYHIDKHLTGVFFILLTLLIPITFVTILFYAVKGLIEIIYNRQNLTYTYCSSTILAVITLAYIFLSPWNFNSDSLESNVEMTACYEGTQNQSLIKFRQDKSFEIHSTGVFFTSFWHQDNGLNQATLF